MDVHRSVVKHTLTDQSRFGQGRLGSRFGQGSNVSKKIWPSGLGSRSGSRVWPSRRRVWVGAQVRAGKNAEKVGRSGEDGCGSTETENNDGDGGWRRLRQTEKKAMGGG
ncbi:hypothetical protein ACLOJK_018614 [Asimina triloba]